jgi:hypothetical protein
MLSSVPRPDVTVYKISSVLCQIIVVLGPVIKGLGSYDLLPSRAPPRTISTVIVAVVPLCESCRGGEEGCPLVFVFVTLSEGSLDEEEDDNSYCRSSWCRFEG